MRFDEYVINVPRIIPRSWKPNCPSETTFTSSAYSPRGWTHVDHRQFLVAHVVEWAICTRCFPSYFYLP